MEVLGTLSQIFEIANGIITTSNAVSKIVEDIVADVSRLRTSLENKKAEIDRMLMSEFSSATREVSSQGSQTQAMFRNLCHRWHRISDELSQAMRYRRLEAWKLRELKEQISAALTFSSSCEHSYDIFKERLNEAFKIALRLCGRLQSGAEQAMAGARKAKIGGYGAAGVMGAGAVACAVGAFFTGGLSLIGTAVLGAGAAAAAKATKKHAGELENLANEFKGRISNIDESIRNMDRLADQVEKARQQGLSACQRLEDKMFDLQREEEWRRRAELSKRTMSLLDIWKNS